MKRLLVYTEDFLPASQSFIANQINSINRHKVEVLCGKTQKSAHVLTSKIPIHVIAESRRMQLSELLLKLPRLGCPLLVPPLRGISLIHAHFGKNGFVVQPLAKAANVPLVTTFHGFDATFNGRPSEAGGFNQVRFFKYGRSQMAKRGERCIAVSRFVRNQLIDRGFREEQIFRHYIGLNLGLFKPTLEPREKGLVVSVARFNEYKGHRYMIDALSRVSRQGQRIKFVMVGDGPLKSEIVHYARQSIPEVEVRSDQSQSQIKDLLSAAQVYLHGSVTLDNGHAEAFGLANLEAQAVGTPVVAFDSGGVGEAVVQGRTGLLCRERDVEGMAEAVSVILTDSQRWLAYSDEAVRMVNQNFEINTQTGVLENYYSDVISEAERAVRK